MDKLIEFIQSLSLNNMRTAEKKAALKGFVLGIAAEFGVDDACEDDDLQPIRLAFVADLEGATLCWLPTNMDIAFFVGSLSKHGTLEELKNILEDIVKVKNYFKARNVVIIGGRNDMALDEGLDGEADLIMERQSRASIRSDFAKKDPSIILLKHGFCEITLKKKTLKVFGSSMSSSGRSGAAAFEVSEDELDEALRSVPVYVDILLTSFPPRGYVDGRSGSRTLTRLLHQKRPRIHAFGGTVNSYGKAILRNDQRQRDYEQRIGILGEEDGSGLGEEEGNGSGEAEEMPAEFRLGWNEDVGPEDTVLINASGAGEVRGREPIIYLLD